MRTFRWTLSLGVLVAFASFALAAKPKIKEEPKIPLVAIMPLTGNGVDEATSASVTEALSDELMKTGHLRVMERSQMEKILKEQGFQQSGACDGSECAVEVGKLLSINRMVVGTLGKLGSAWTFSVRGIDVQTGEILGSARRQQKGEIEDVVPAVMPGLADELVAGILGQKVAPRKLTVPTVAPVVTAPVVAPVVETPRVPVVPAGMVAIAGGCFQMGSTDGEADEKPVHQVCLDAFALDALPVSNSAYRRAGHAAHYGDGLCYNYNVSNSKWEQGTTPDRFQGADQPVVCVDWTEAEAFCREQGKRLPTEAEYEYANRASSQSKWQWGNDPDRSCEFANIADQTVLSNGNNWGTKAECNDGYSDVTSPVGHFRPNAWGLYDMTGNVWEWTNDWYGEGYYGSSPSRNPKGPSTGDFRVLRGGSWFNYPTVARAANRGGVSPGNRYSYLGFRCAR